MTARPGRRKAVVPDDSTDGAQPAPKAGDPDSSLLAESRAELVRECANLDAAALRSSVWVVLGVGILGSEVVRQLALLGVGCIVLVDPDLVETRNLARGVVYGPRDLGTAKVHAAAARLEAWAPETEVVAIPGDLRWDLGSSWLLRADATLCCVDNRASRLALSRRCGALDVAWFDGAVAEDVGRTNAFLPTRGGCYECTLTPAQWEEVLSASAAPSCAGRLAASWADGRVPTTPLAASMTAALMVRQALDLVHARRLGLAGRLPDWGMERYAMAGVGRVVHSRYGPDPDCGSHAPLAAARVGTPASATDPLSTAFRAAADALADTGARFEPWSPLVTRSRCRRCGRSEAPWTPLGSPGCPARCPRCTGPVALETVTCITRRSPAASSPMCDLGIPPSDLLRFHAADGRWCLVELGGDLARVPKVARDPAPRIPRQAPARIERATIGTAP